MRRIEEDAVLESENYEGARHGLHIQGIVQIVDFGIDLIDKICSSKVPEIKEEMLACSNSITEKGDGEVLDYANRNSVNAADGGHRMLLSRRES